MNRRRTSCHKLTVDKTPKRKDKPAFTLPPIPTLDCYREDPWSEHPLLRYNARKERKRLDNEVVVRRGKRVKNSVADVVYHNQAKEDGSKEDDDLESFLTPDDFAEYRRDSVKNGPVIPIQRAWLKRISSLVSLELKKRNFELFKSLAKEVEERYEMVIHEHIINYVLTPPFGYVNPYELVEKYPLFSTAPPPWAQRYKINRQIMLVQLRMLYNVAAKTFFKLNEDAQAHKMFDPTKLRKKGQTSYMSPTALRDVIVEQIHYGGRLFLQQLTPQLMKMYHNPNSLRHLNEAKQELLIDNVSQMINTYATTWAVNTLREIVAAYEDHRRFLPRIFLNTTIKDRRVTYAPPLEGWLECLNTVAHEIVTVVQKIPDVAELFWTRNDKDKKNPTVFSNIEIPPGFINMMTERFKTVMTVWLEDAVVVADRIYEEYQILLDGTLQTKLEELVADKEQSFYAPFKESAVLKALTKTVYNIPKNEFVGWLEVNNEKVRTKLLDECKRHQDILSDHLMKWIRAHHVAIISSYKDMRDKLLKRPDTTAELFELTDYIDEARGDLLMKLKEDITEGLKMVLAYMDFYVLDPSDVKLTCTAWKLYKKIQPAFEKSSIMVEDQKILFEEQLHEKVEDMKVELKNLLRRIKEDFVRFGNYEDVPKYVEDIRFAKQRVEELQKGIDWINNEESLFKFNKTTFEDMEVINNHLDPYVRLYETTLKWQRAEKKYLDGDFDLDASKIDEETTAYLNELEEVQQIFKERIKAQKEQEAREKHVPLSLIYDEDNLQEIPPPLKLCNDALESLKKFRENMPAIYILCNPAMRLRHWMEMADQSDIDMIPDTGSSLRKLLEMHMDPFMEEFDEVSFGATQEFTLENTVGAMQEDWSAMKIEPTEYKETQTSILEDAEELKFLLKQQIEQTQILKGSKFAVPHRDMVSQWLKEIMQAKATIDEWLRAQKRWVYLEHMFSSEDIHAVLPEESALFKQADEIWRNVMAELDGQVNGLETAKNPELYARIHKCAELLEKVLKGLNEYLEDTRTFFPRLYFLTNEEMVLILAETSDANKVQPYLTKLFPGVNEVRIDSEMLAFGMLSTEGERVTLTNPVDTGGVKGCVEKWLRQLEESMVHTMKTITVYAKDAYVHTPRSEWIQKWPGQVVVTVSQIYWTNEVHKAFIRGTSGLQTFLQKWNTYIENEVAVLRGDIQKLQRCVLGALVTVDIHARDTLQELISHRVQDENDFLWVSQLRYYFEDFAVSMKMLNAQVAYGYEYMGSPTRLVMTPLTDRCFRLILGAFHLNFNACLIGPSSSGKSETAKDLAKALGKLCIVFQSSEDLDCVTLGRIVKGLASSGAWVVFDDFNRMKPEVMSVLAQDLWNVHQALSSKLNECTLGGVQVPLNKQCLALIITNPGYAGRNDVPDNLKVLFRPVAIMVPDFYTICEMTLYSMGFIDSKSLARKILDVPRLCSEQLSSQNHYDFNLRAVKACITAAGNLKLKNPKENEAQLLLKSINDLNLSKFVSQDIPLYEGIVSDIFPRVQVLPPELDPLIEALKAVCERNGLQPTDFFIEKTLQIYEMMLVRHGLMIVGEAMGGKTSAYQSLAEALNDMKANKTPGFVERRVQYMIVCPKALTMGQLYGKFDPETHEWSDGIVAKTFRDMATSNNDDRKWMIFDGPVDPVWIENMNTVLDDNKKMCLTSGEMIQMTPLMTMLFEPPDLDQASPATVSRCGMIYFEPKQLGWRPLKDSYLSHLPPGIDDQGEMIEELMEWLIPPCLNFVKHECTSFISTSELHQFQSFTRLFSSFLKSESVMPPRPSRMPRKTSFAGGDSDDDETPAVPPPVVEEEPPVEGSQDPIWVQCAFIFSIVWSIGAALTKEGRDKFEPFYRSLLLGTHKDVSRPKSFKLAKNQMFPEKGSIFDFTCDKKNNKWVLWIDTIDKELLKISESSKVNELIVSTEDTSRQTFFLKTYLNNEHPVLLIGPSGTGKTAVTRNYLLSLSKDKFVPNCITFSSRTSANQAQEVILSKLERRRKGVFGPPAGKKCILFVDDISMPQKEKYGAQPPIELLRQWIDHGNWYQENNTTLTLEEMNFVAAMPPPKGGRNNISPRLVRHLSLLSIDSFDDTTLKKIFSAVVDWHFAKGYDSDVIRISKSTVPATMAIYNAAVSLFLPVPSKSHYLFNLRDFSRVIRGLLLIPPSNLRDGAKLMRLWVHEVYRVFYDRLVDPEDRLTFFKLVSTTVKDSFQTGLDKLLGHLNPNPKKPIDDVAIRSLVFGAYIDPAAEEKVYDEVTDMKALGEIMDGYLQSYNTENDGKKDKMNLVLFPFAIEHISRIARVLKQDNGHALIVGMWGSGRRSLTKLAAFMAGYDLMEIKLSRHYGAKEWREDLKKVLKHAGNDGKQTVFLFNDTQMKEESFVEDISMILDTGDVPNLFQAADRGEILGNMQVASKVAGKKMETSPIVLYNFFSERVRSNLHIVLVMSPVGEAYRKRLQMFPSLIDCCTIDWFSEWPEDALVMVAQRFLAPLDTEPEVREACVTMCQNFHVSVRNLSQDFYDHLARRNYVTPTSYLELLIAFKALFGRQRKDIEAQRQKYLLGLNRLESAAQQVAVMKKEMEALKVKLVETSAEIAKLMVKIEVETAEAEEVKVVVAADEVLANTAAAAAQVIKEDCEGDLAEAMPALNAALRALDTLKPSDIAVVKSMKNPPNGVKMVCEAVCVMRSIKPEKRVDPNGRPYDDYWAASLKMLADMKFLDQLKEYDKDNIPPAAMAKIREKFIKSPDFDPAKIHHVSTACEGICKWIKALELYDKVIKVVKPKRMKLAAAENELKTQLEKLEEKRRMLQEIMDKIQKLKDEYDAANKKKKELEDYIELCSQRLQTAERIIHGLSGEKARITEGAAMLLEKLENCVGDVLLACGVITYLGPFTIDFRQGCTDNWHKACTSSKIPCSKTFSLIETLGDPTEISRWHLSGLPIDNFSIENGIIATCSRKFPLLIDPGAQANKWIRNLEKKRRLTVVKQSDPGYLKTVQNCMKLGIPVLLDSVGEEIDPALDPILNRQTYKHGKKTYIRLGEKGVEYHQRFGMYVITRMRNPHYYPETTAKLKLVNFTPTPLGLQDQLLGIVAAREEPALEEQKNRLIVEGVANTNLLKATEDKILDVFASSKGNLLEDDKAVKLLTTSIETTAEIKVRQKANAEMEKRIDETRNLYRPVAIHATTIFFCISDLANIDHMYQYSIEWFINLYILSIGNSRQAKELATRIQYLNEHIAASIYRNVCRSLFEKDKLVFSFVLCVALMKGTKDFFDKKTWKFLLTGEGSSSPPSGNPPPNPAPDWLSDKSWAQVVKLSGVQKFADLSSHVSSHVGEWKQLYEAPEPQDFSMPAPWGNMGELERLCILRCFRLDKLIPAVQGFVSRNLGKEFIEPPAFDLETTFNDSNAATPLVFILSPSADPTLRLFKFAADKGFTGSKIQAVSLGSCQGPLVKKMIDEAITAGNWIVLQNCHLAASWMPVLESITQDVITKESVNPSFRLWLTSYPTPDFPVTVVQNSVKMTTEAPRGLKANLLKSYTSIPLSDPTFFNSVKANAKAWHKMLFSLCFFHSVVQERKRFGALGWNNSYEFSEGDLRISFTQLQMYLTDYTIVPFDALTYLTGECNYGGRVYDERDRRLLNSLLSIFYSKNVVDQDNYVLSSSGTYHIPGDANHNVSIRYIRDLPFNPHPEVFGLHENADITRGNKESLQLLEGALSTQSEFKSGSGEFSDAFGPKVIAVAQDILKNLPPDFPIKVISEKYPVDYMNSMNTVLRTELVRYNRLLKVVRETMADVQKAIKGFIVMSSELDEVFKSMTVGKVPQAWASKSYPSLKSLGSYVTDLFARLAFFQEWISRGTPPVFWISGFYFTQSFLTGLMQNYARKFKVPIDQLGFEFDVTSFEKGSDVQSNPGSGAYCRGIFLEAARWDRGSRQLAESYPKILFDPMPVVWFKPGVKTKFVAVPAYECPLYITSARKGHLSTIGQSSNFVLNLKLLTNLPQQHWINRGTAALCQLDE